MTLKKLVVAGFAVAALMMPAFGALAQDAAPAAPANGAAAPAAAAPAAATPADPSKNWLKVCDPIADGKKACIMRQVVVANGQFLGSFLLRDDPGQESRLLAVAAVPLGVLLPFGLTWQIDGGKPIRVPFMLCDPQSCATQLVINEAYVNSLKKGGVLKLTAKNRQNKDLVIDISLAGFTSVYDGEAAMTFDEFNKQATTSTALEKQLQDRAEQLRQQMGTDGATPAPAPAAPQ
ncbi:MAG: invasion associated locus B family protein [Devosia sp.]|uniref:invasion associated locus B family protein n=1 Tax=Devosia sp. TaxID=1871048 RepID=UPI001AD27BAD|nr:invasion associated locus B family protein [Devosia sp.]MBN9314279.1 invasion associated locus B family protein [Devosia sp.]